MISRKADVGRSITSKTRHKKELVVTTCHRHHFGHERRKIGRKFRILGAFRFQVEKGQFNSILRKFTYININ